MSENFRVACQATYKLDPLNYITAASLSWDAMMLNTDLDIGLISDAKIMDMMDRGNRGGLTFVGRQTYATANNTHLPYSDTSKGSSYNIYIYI